MHVQKFIREFDEVVFGHQNYVSPLTYFQQHQRSLIMCATLLLCFLLVALVLSVYCSYPSFNRGLYRLFCPSRKNLKHFHVNTH
ncbi:hypothetical protein EON64_14300 [archaeon]|nr:MAG: hypothetical protein EON64_14300 [archaeon]